MARDPRIERGLIAQLTERHRRIEGGEKALGWKLGFGTKGAMDKLGIAAPLVGYLLDSARVDSGATVSIDGWGNARLEPEVAAHMGADLPGGAGREQALAAIAGWGVAIELVDPDPDASDPEPILAGDIFQRHVLLGPPQADADPAALSARVLRGGEETAAADDATEATGELVDLVLHVARTLDEAGERLRAGEVIICGSIVPALEIAPGETLEVTVDPLGSLTVSFE